jgi:hypothetical protein
MGALLLAGCAQAASKPVTDVKPPVKETIVANAPAVEATFAGKRPARPPLLNVDVDVTLRNADSSPRWFVLPTYLPESKEDRGGVDGVELHEMSGSGRAVVGKFLGTGGFQAVLLAPGAEVKITKLTVGVWQQGGPLKGALPIEVVIAKDLTVGGEPAEKWFGTVAAASDKQVSGDFSKSRISGSKTTDDHGEVPVVFGGERRVTVDVTVP